jgi:hypothetical protein
MKQLDGVSRPPQEKFPNLLNDFIHMEYHRMMMLLERKRTELLTTEKQRRNARLHATLTEKIHNSPKNDKTTTEFGSPPKPAICTSSVTLL